MDLNIFKYSPFNQKGNAETHILTTEDDLNEISNRLLNTDGSFNVVRKGNDVQSLYQNLMNASWLKFMSTVTALFIFLNCVFAILFTICGVQHIGVTPSSGINDFLQSFYFSVQTFTTLGYGNMSPDNHITNILASIDSFTGMMTVALLTGLFFSRFSKPRAYINFSEHILVGPDRNGDKSLQFRIVHEVSHKIIDLEARVTMTWLENSEGRVRRMFAKLPLQIERIFLFPLNWTIIHNIDEASPLYNLEFSEIKARNVEILVVIKGYDETYSTIVHADRSYQCSDLKFGAKFLPMYQIRKEDTILNLDKLNDHEPYSLD